MNYERGLDAVEAREAVCPEGATMAQFALRWILMFDAVTCAIPGAKRPTQVEENVEATDLLLLSGAPMRSVPDIYNRYVCADEHHY